MSLGDWLSRFTPEPKRTDARGKRLELVEDARTPGFVLGGKGPHASQSGGSGSGWQGAKKATVEDSLSLSMVALMTKRALVPGAWTRGSWQWSYET